MPEILYFVKFSRGRYGYAAGAAGWHNRVVPVTKASNIRCSPNGVRGGVNPGLVTL